MPVARHKPIYAPPRQFDALSGVVSCVAEVLFAPAFSVAEAVILACETIPETLPETLPIPVSDEGI
jgi:hypothetical protein